jgi:hypothetical protein
MGRVVGRQNLWLSNFRLSGPFRRSAQERVKSKYCPKLAATHILWRRIQIGLQDLFFDERNVFGCEPDQLSGRTGIASRVHQSQKVFRLPAVIFARRHGLPHLHPTTHSEW